MKVEMAWTGSRPTLERVVKLSQRKESQRFSWI